jgi:hypothetical protein
MKQIVCTCCFLLVFAPATVFAQGAVGALQTGSIEQRIDAMLNIGYARNRAGFWYLVKYLEYDRAEEETATAVRLRVAAAESLGRLNDERAIPHLVERFGKEQSPEVKARILFALGMYRDERARQVIAGALDDKS